MIDECKGQTLRIQLDTAGISHSSLCPIIEISEEQQIWQQKTLQMIDNSCWAIMRKVLSAYRMNKKGATDEEKTFRHYSKICHQSEHLSWGALLPWLGNESTIVSCGWSYLLLGREIIATSTLYFVYPSEAASGQWTSEKTSSVFFLFLVRK